MAMKYEQQGKKTKRYWHLLSIGAAEDCYRLFGETEKHGRMSSRKQEKEAVYGKVYNVEEQG